MNQPTDISKRRRQREQERFQRRLRTYMSKAEKLRADFGIQVYTVIHKGGKYWEYSSVKEAAWPPTRDTLVSIEKTYTP